jgi:hypothetical protein
MYRWPKVVVIEAVNDQRRNLLVANVGFNTEELNSMK